MARTCELSASNGEECDSIAPEAGCVLLPKVKLMGTRCQGLSSEHKECIFQDGKSSLLRCSLNTGGRADLLRHSFTIGDPAGEILHLADHVSKRFVHGMHV